jgi:beta-lactamase class D
MRASVVSALMAAIALVALTIGGGCAAPSLSPIVSADLAAPLRELGLDGTVVLFDPKSDRCEASDPERARRGFLPASTFKIMNALVALEVGSVADEHATIRWDGVDRGSPAWNRDHDLASAMRVSAVWFYQELARRTGRARMQEWIDRVGYGNRDLSGPIDTFWLDGQLRITPLQQIEFLRRLEQGTLPFSARSQSIVRRILERERGDGYVVRGKTGWANRCEPAVGWYVGWVERDRGPLFFAINVDLKSDADAPKRFEVARRVLLARGALPPGATAGE